MSSSKSLVPQGQKASDYDNSDPVPPRQNVVPSAEKTDSSQQGLEFLFSPLLEEYYNPTQDVFAAERTTMIKQRMHHFTKINLQPFLVHVKFPMTRDHPIEQVHGNPTMPVQTRRQLATDPEMCMFALTEEGIDFEGSFAPVALSWKHSVDLLAHTAHKTLSNLSLDVKNGSFYNGPLKKRFTLLLPKGFRLSRSSKKSYLSKEKLCMD
ncbi:hypothetical protein Tco_1484861 [Tanacetum coccineum]